MLSNSGLVRDIKPDIFAVFRARAKSLFFHSKVYIRTITSHALPVAHPHPHVDPHPPTNIDSHPSTPSTYTHPPISTHTHPMNTHPCAWGWVDALSTVLLVGACG